MPSWHDLKRFCERDGWELYKKTDHGYFQKLMPDGVLKKAKVSMGTEALYMPIRQMSVVSYFKL